METGLGAFRTYSPAGVAENHRQTSMWPQGPYEAMKGSDVMWHFPWGVLFHIPMYSPLFTHTQMCSRSWNSTHIPPHTHTRHAFSHSTDIHVPWPPALGPANMCTVFCHAQAGIPIWPCHTPLTTYHTPYSTRHMRGHRLTIPPVLPCPHKSHCTAVVPVILKILLQRLPQRCRLPGPQMSPLLPPQDWAWLMAS